VLSGGSVLYSDKVLFSVSSEIQFKVMTMCFNEV
jgi:hypothetical protein